MDCLLSAPVDKETPSLIEQLSCRVGASLELSDGSCFHGYSFGHTESTTGEVVFNTGMVGYPESLSDPSYAGQILVLTYPLVGNYGVPAEERDPLGLLSAFESDRIHVKAIVVSDHSWEGSHYTAHTSLNRWLQQHRVPGIYGVDTRALTKLIRTHGALLGKLLVQSDPVNATLEFCDPNATNLVAGVSRKDKEVFCPGDDDVDQHAPMTPMCGDTSQTPPQKPWHIVAVDCGIKNNIIRYLVYRLRLKVTVVPWDYDFTQDEFDGLFISNGPGDPVKCVETIEHVRSVMESRPRLPIFGICLGNQILALAAGAKTYKMKFGNRGMNQPCIDLRTTRCYITSQNHGFAVDSSSLPQGWMPLMMNANDGSNEGIIHIQRPWLSVQFHPEACAGPTDTSFLFSHFVRNISSPSYTGVTTIPFTMPQTYHKVLVLGSGGLTIGQAGEFDYSGSQAIKALRESGVQSVLINPNVATVQTSWGLADRVYFLPVTPEFVEQVIRREKPDGVLCTFGGQTALNCAVELEDQGIFKQYGVQVLGTPIQAIVTTEDRELFSRAVETCGYKVAESSCCSSVGEAVEAAERIGYPVLVRAAFALGGLGSGFCENQDELRSLVQVSLAFSAQVIVDKSLKGWKELEYEVVRDASDNCITVCNMENFDPMGIHTGDSIVIAPSQTLTNSEYYRLRECALKVVRHIGIVGECNIQYAVDPKSREFRIIEVNARLSRSSALASKATGYPLAYVAAKLALGSDLVKLRNSVTLCTTACFEPSLDYVVVKVPRWDLRKFTSVDQSVGSCMKSVGEVMAIGRTFEEVIQKALRMVEDGCTGFDSKFFDQELLHRAVDGTLDNVCAELQKPSPTRIWAIAKAFDLGASVERVSQLTNIDPWFLMRLHHIHSIKMCLSSCTLVELLANTTVLQESKRCGFADRQIAAQLLEGVGKLCAVPHHGYVGGSVNEAHVRSVRKAAGICPLVKQIDTLAAEFPAETNYLYLTYSGVEHDVNLEAAANEGPVKLDQLPDATHQVPEGATLNRAARIPRIPYTGTVKKHDDKKSRILVLGCGPYRIGSSVEFDWCSVSCTKTLRSLGHEAIVINCNPETVSTDFDESDRLYFEELSRESVLDIAELEKPEGTVISVGGQTPNNLAMTLHENGVKILGTSVAAIDMCENRYKFSKLCDEIGVDQPEWSEFTTVQQAHCFCCRVGYPTLVRPSYVLSGAAMRVVNSDDELKRFLATAAVVSPDYPVVISKYISGAKEVELDAVGSAGVLLNYAIAEHVENAGVHSGDASLLLPAQKLFVETHRRVKMIGAKLCKALRISGPFNVQFICKENEVKVIECNLRASRSLPFISKTYNVNFIDLATRVMLGSPVHPVLIQPIDMEHVAAKVPMFSFGRLKNSDPKLGVEMQSTGEVACFGVNQYDAFLKGMIAAGFRLPKKNVALSIGPSDRKLEFAPFAQLLIDMGFTLMATDSTRKTLISQGNIQAVQLIHKPQKRREPNMVTYLKSGRIDLLINVPDSMDFDAQTDGFEMRRAAIDSGTPLITEMKTAILTIMALHRKWIREKSGKSFFSLLSWQEYVCSER